MSLSCNCNSTSDDLMSALNSASNRLRDLESRITGVLTKQQEMQSTLDSLRSKSEDTEESDPPKEPEAVKFPEDCRFKEELQKAVEGMQSTQKSWMDDVQAISKAEGGTRGLKIFKEIEKHLTDRLAYLDATKALIEGPLVEEPPPPPPEETPAETEEEEAEVKSKKKKSPKDKSKKKKKK